MHRGVEAGEDYSVSKWKLRAARIEADRLRHAEKEAYRYLWHVQRRLAKAYDDIRELYGPKQRETEQER